MRSFPASATPVPLRQAIGLGSCGRNIVISARCISGSTSPRRPCGCVLAGIALNRNTLRFPTGHPQLRRMCFLQDHVQCRRRLAWNRNNRTCGRATGVWNRFRCAVCGCAGVQGGGRFGGGGDFHLPKQLFGYQSMVVGAVGHCFPIVWCKHHFFTRAGRTSMR